VVVGAGKDTGSQGRSIELDDLGRYHGQQSDQQSFQKLLNRRHDET
jgi:hypothetical protein